HSVRYSKPSNSCWSSEPLVDCFRLAPRLLLPFLAFIRRFFSLRPSLLSLDCPPRLRFTHEYHEPDPSVSLALLSWKWVGLESGVENSSDCCSSSNFVKVMRTRMVGTMGMAN
ncbi:hypothetical protein GW17_00001941, partial [Ensete ventricosum]